MALSKVVLRGNVTGNIVSHGSDILALQRRTFAAETFNSTCKTNMFTKSPMFVILIQPLVRLKSSNVFRKKAIGYYKHYLSKTQPAQNCVNMMTNIFAELCTAVAVQRVRRTAQLLSLYDTMYTVRVLKFVIDKFRHGIIKKTEGNKRLFMLFSAVMFSWEQDHITDDELSRLMLDMEKLETDKDTSLHSCENNMNVKKTSNTEKQADIHQNHNGLETSWELLIDRCEFKLWRKPVPDSYLYQYKVYGSYHDIPARAFYNVQVDLDYRRKWDKLIEHLSIVDRDTATNSDVVHWISHFPYPMYSREYVYVRRHMINEEHNMMIIVNRAVDHPKCPLQDKYVRVETYNTKLVIHPHTTFDQNGFDYVLTYFDDPKAAFPTFAYNWMAKTGVPDFVDKVHQAAKDLHEHKRMQPSVANHPKTEYNSQANLNM